MLHDLCSRSFVPTLMYKPRFHQSPCGDDYYVDNVAANTASTDAGRQKTYFLYVFYPSSLGGQTNTEYSSFTDVAKVGGGSTNDIATMAGIGQT